MERRRYAIQVDGIVTARQLELLHPLVAVAGRESAVTVLVGALTPEDLDAVLTTVRGLGLVLNRIESEGGPDVPATGSDPGPRPG